MRLTMRPLMIVAALAAGGVAVPGVAEADGWRGRGNGWGHGWGGPPPRVYHHHHNRGWRGNDAALGAIIGLGAGVVIGSVLAPPPPPPPRVYYYAPPPPPPVVYAPAPGQWVQPPPVWVPAQRLGW